VAAIDSAFFFSLGKTPYPSNKKAPADIAGALNNLENNN
jgi:hypothetical protein